METLTAKVLYVSSNGEVSCPEHGGTYLRLANDYRPNAPQHVTPLEVWDRVETDFLVMFVDSFGKAPKCGRC